MKTYVLIEIEHDEKKLSANEAMAKAEDRIYRMENVSDAQARPVPAIVAQKVITQHRLVPLESVLQLSGSYQ